MNNIFAMIIDWFLLMIYFLKDNRQEELQEVVDIFKLVKATEIKLF